VRCHQRRPPASPLAPPHWCAMLESQERPLLSLRHYTGTRYVRSYCFRPLLDVHSDQGGKMQMANAQASGIISRSRIFSPFSSFSNWQNNKDDMLAMTERKEVWYDGLVLFVELTIAGNNSGF
jgi:hypothetical protein